ncbi:uncharacterized protein EI97DRAFT_443326 [Westerdykella ornata]|uniref:Uncharacterized protein n=1 Tax=Westerdykella ornata TaxID=318751 RepID=A0A6A6JKR4_WESOR|nr:uncharacterized protein EI97DRAFT_443326 [Westerdykella ornata]KAF2275479.1 hypothetical protein EI97DRAFT_443326 [Westerdykella ornata]
MLVTDHHCIAVRPPIYNVSSTLSIKDTVGELKLGEPFTVNLSQSLYGHTQALLYNLVYPMRFSRPCLKKTATQPENVTQSGFPKPTFLLSMSSSKSPTTALANTPHLPDEIKFKILKELFDDSVLRGSEFLRFERKWADSLLKLPGWAHLVPEAVYGDKRVILEMMFKDFTEPDRRAIYVFPYPPPLAAQHIRILQLRFNGYTGISDHSRVPAAMVRFLRRLQAGQLGFDNLELLRVVVNHGVELPKKRGFHRKFVRDFSRLRPFHFEADKLEVEMNYHICENSCYMYRDRLICELIARLRAQLTDGHNSWDDPETETGASHEDEEEA